MNLIGFVQALLLNISLISGLNDPQTKITPVGFLRALYENNAMTQINNIDELRSGKTRDIKLRYMQRGLEASVTDVDDCDTPVTPEWKEAEIKMPFFSKIGIFISEDDMRKYQTQADETMTVTGNGANPSGLTVPIMRALYETIVVNANALLQHMDTKLVTAQNGKWGVNVATGDANAQAITLGDTPTQNDGYVKLLSDAQLNEVNDSLVIVGSGKVSNYDIYQRIKTGIDSKGVAALPLNSYFDPKTASIWGANHFGMFARGMVGIVDWNANVGTYAGQKPNGSYFFTIPLPMQVGNEVVPVVFDAQLEYVSCNTFDTDGEQVGKRGYKLILSKHYGLFNTPNDAFKTGDRLYGMNGSFHYVAQ